MGGRVQIVRNRVPGTGVDRAQSAFAKDGGENTNKS